jgi:predicted 3-demethylubiquinone-9 3-methyltransferase (glyoxalase superfamily)
MQKITTLLTFDGRAEEAVDFYTSIFPNSRILSSMRGRATTVGAEGELVSATFELAGQEFIAVNGGSASASPPGVSLFVDCEDQDEVDALWEKLVDGGETGSCGWVTDRFGISWQVVPRPLGELLADDDGEKTVRALLRMSKIELVELRRAYDGGEIAPATH